MEAAKRKLLEQTHKIIIKEGLESKNPERLLKITSPNIVGLGTTYDEKIVGLKEAKALLERQKEQGKGLSFSYETNNLGIHISEDKNTAVFIDEIKLSITTEGETITMDLRFSIVLEYLHNKWFLVHFHTSKPEKVESEKDTWGIETWKEKAEELEREISERTADLVLKNRELAIQAAMERVRARSMAMQSSDELHEVIGVVFQQFDNLGIHPVNVFLSLFHREERTLTYRASGKSGKRTPTKQEIDIDSMEAWSSLYDKWIKDSSDDVEVIFYPKEIVPDILSLLKETFAAMPKDERMTVKDFPEGGYSTLGYTPFGYLGYDHTRLPTEEEKDILKRICMEFGRVYQRFLDIQKAEAQAREAQIEAALERVRSTSMAMHKTEDISEVVSVLFDQLKNLNVAFKQSWITILHLEKGYFDTWFSPIDDIYDTPQHFKMPSAFFEETTIKTWKSEAPFSYLSLKTKAEVEEFMKACDTISASNYFTHSQSILQLERIEFLEARHHYGFLSKSNPEAPTEREEDILQRFAKVFEQAYTRFLDIEKAEAQAREAQIEVALERVRARAMAMHHPDELTEVLALMFEQLSDLNVETLWTHLTLIDLDNNTFTYRMTSKDGTPVHTEQVVQLDAMDAWSHTVETFKSQNPETITHIHFLPEMLPKVWELFDGIFSSLPGEAKMNPTDFPNGIHTTESNCKFGYLGINQSREATAEEKKILGRFGSEFGRLYQRYLDIEKAQAQAREAQIEAALERIRAKAMAMHNSSELTEVLTVFFEQYDILEIYPKWAHLSLIDVEDNTFTYRMTGPKGKRHMAEQIISIDARPEWQDAIEIFKKADPDKVSLLHFPKEVLPQVWDLSSETLNSFPVGEGFHFDDFPNGLYNVQGHCKFGFIGFNHNRPATEEEKDIVVRFAKEFGRLYQRFLDIQKAEAQAREAKIEMALEKVRSRTMAMQTSSELPEAANTLFLEVQALGIPAWSAGYCIWNEDKSFANCNMSSEGEIQKGFMLPAIGEGYDFLTPLKKGEKFYVSSLGGKDLVKHYDFMKTLPGVGEILSELTNAGLELPTFQIFHICYFKHGYVMFITYEPVLNAHDVFKRFTSVFEQTYTRFLDLKQAEAQVRKAQIEASLERVRAKAMSMQNSDELDEVLSVLCEQFDILGILPMSTHMTVFDFENNIFTFRETGKYGNRSFGEQTVELDAMDNWKETVDKWKTDQATAINKLHFPKEQLPKVWEVFHESFASMPEGSRITPEDYPDGIYHTAGKHPFGYIGMNQIRPATLEEEQIIIKFANEFGRAYQRFLDLQKAEAQAREAQIEAALERVRSQSMGMQSTSDFGHVTTEMFNQLRSLGEDLFATGIVFCDKHEGHVEQWHSIPGGGMLSPFIVPIDLDYIHQYRYDQWKEGNALFSIEIPSDFIEQHFEDIFKLPSAQLALKDLESRNAPMPAAPPWEIDYGASFKNGYILISSLKYLENTDILKRFAKVFEQAYTRFLDLQKAEEQAREAKIEASLERVRAKTMAMHKSEDLSEVAMVLFEQISLLTETPSRFNIAILNEEEQLFDIWVTDQKGHNLNKLFVFDVQKSEIVAEVYKAFQAKERHIIQHMSGERLKNWIEYASKEAGVPFNKKEIKEDRYINSIFFRHGCIGITTNEMPDHTVIQLLERFTQVFEQSFTRFLDLEKAEAQAREAQIEAALEKVRSRSLAMHQSTEMQKVVNEIREQVLFLGLKIDALAMSGVIDNESDYDVWVGGANSQKPLRIPYNNDTKIQRDFNKAIKERPDLFTKTYTGKVMKDYFKALLGTGNSFNPEIEQFMLTCTGFTTTLTFMKNSGIQIIRYTEESFSDADNAIIIRFGKVFEQAYIRFLDLQKAEAQTLLAEQNLIQLKTEKQRAEEALSELQQTQTQLIQSEKMASLGELTAGIAHEIQNPLNFVNNFSEVSKELLGEMREEIENGDFEEVKAIMEDIIQNLEKINHHGKRADGIVKGMLQHSRSSTGTKEPTDINALADEYLRLAYHGLRAKDKSFNAELITDFDDSIGNINVIPQDMGRVILNLITNAFYASNERKQASKDQGFKPIVSVSTKKIGDHLEIKVTDNGNGIPKEVVDKIFQPFFTTKPTGQGTGLGLSMSYDIVTKVHGGELKVDTKEGEGAVFRIFIPLNTNN